MLPTALATLQYTLQQQQASHRWWGCCCHACHAAALAAWAAKASRGSHLCTSQLMRWVAWCLVCSRQVELVDKATFANICLPSLCNYLCHCTYGSTSCLFGVPARPTCGEPRARCDTCATVAVHCCDCVTTFTFSRAALLKCILTGLLQGLKQLPPNQIISNCSTLIGPAVCCHAVLSLVGAC